MNSIELLKTDLLTWSGAHEGKFKLAFDKGLSRVTSGKLNYEQYLEKLVFYKGAEALKALEEAMSPATRAALIADGHIKLTEQQQQKPEQPAQTFPAASVKAEIEVKPTSQQEVLPTNTLANEKAAEPAPSENVAKPEILPTNTLVDEKTNEAAKAKVKSKKENKAKSKLSNKDTPKHEDVTKTKEKAEHKKVAEAKKEDPREEVPLFKKDASKHEDATKAKIAEAKKEEVTKIESSKTEPKLQQASPAPSVETVPEEVELNQFGLPKTPHKVSFATATFSKCFTGATTKVAYIATEAKAKGDVFKWSSFQSGVPYLLYNEVHNSKTPQSAKNSACAKWFADKVAGKACGSWNGEMGKWKSESAKPVECVCFREKEINEANAFCMGEFLDNAHD